ncbi:hypothetical protein FACS1894189_2810 [Planctomycetales bacterium]|nr:hypothetical protein FACS1894189_2810 [Planctomycetales bacterium]
MKDTAKRTTRKRGFTLLELLLAMALFVVLLGIVWNIVLLFMRTQIHSTQQTGRSQIIRAVVQLLDDDLRSTIQDPVLLKNSGEAGEVRHFGLIGSPQQLRIDVLQLDPLSGSSSNQAGNFKAVFYEFQRETGLVRQEINYQSPADAPKNELSIPEIVDCRFRYFDGKMWQDSWESLTEGGLPVSVEITLRSASSAATAAITSRIVVNLSTALP